MEDNVWGLTYNATTSFNSAAHFGCSNYKRSSHYFLCSPTNLSIMTPALTIHTSSPSKEDLSKLRCDVTSPAVTLAVGTFVDEISFYGSVFMRNAFWAIPVYDSGNSIADISWGYAAQWLLGRAGGRLTIYWNGPQKFTVADRNFQVDEFLSKLECKDGDRFLVCVKSVIQTFAPLKAAFDHRISYWLEELENVGYQFPNSAATDSKLKCADPVIFQPVNFVAPVLERTRYGQIYYPITNVNKSRELLIKTCFKYDPVSWLDSDDYPVQLTRPWFQFSDILLVITFNEAHYEVIPYLELLYRSFFPTILYCGPLAPDYDARPELRGYRFSFATYVSSPVGQVPGAFSYECAVKAMRMHYAITGYLVVSDDVLLLPYPLTLLSPHLVWFLPQIEVRVGDLKTLRECRLGMCDFYPHWEWWRDYRQATTNLLDEIDRRQFDSPLIHHCRSELLRLNGASAGGALRPNGAYSDVYYVPTRVARDFVRLAHMSLDHGVFVEIAVPTALRCLELPEEIRPLPGLQIWDISRDEPWRYFSRKHLHGKTYFHPTKWSLLVNDSQAHVSLFCDKVLPFMFDPLARLP